MKYFELILLSIIICIALICSFGIEEPAFSLQKDYLGLSGYPKIIGCFLAFLCVVRIFVLLFSKYNHSDDKENSNNHSHIIIPIFLAIAYVYGISTIGFIISSFIYLAIMPSIIDNKSKGKIFLLKHIFYSCIVTFILYCFFRIFKIYLPSSILF